MMFDSSFGKLTMSQPAFYIPKPSHSLRDVILGSYGIRPGEEPIYSVLVDYLMALNPGIRNPNVPLGIVAPRTLDFISHDPVALLCMNPTVVKARIQQVVKGGGEFAKIDAARNFVPADTAERNVYEFLARISNDTQYLTDFAGVGMGVLGYLSGSQNQAVIGSLEHLNRERLAGRIKLNQYRLQQKIILNNYLKKLGWMGRHMHGGQNAFSILYQNRAVGVQPSPVFAQHAQRMAKLSRFAKGGGILLTGFGVVGACSKIATTSGQQAKNEVLVVDGAGIGIGALGGAAAGMAVGLLVVSGPVGWGVALVASAVGGYFAQEAGKAGGKLLYDQFLNKIDLVGSTGIGQICR